MLEIHGIELVPLDQLHQVGKLHRHYPFRIQQPLHPFEKIIEVGNLSQYIVSDDKVRPLSFRHKTQRRFLTKKTPHSSYAFAFRLLGNVGCRLDTEHWNTLC